MNAFNVDQALVKEAQGMVQVGFNADSVNTGFIARLLKSLDPQVFAEKKPETSASKLLAFRSMPNLKGSTSYQYTASERFGKTKRIQPGVITLDIPFANVAIRELDFRIVPEAINLSYTIDEMDMAVKQTAMGLNYDVIQNKKEAAMLSHMYTWNDVALKGDVASNSTGLFNNPDIPATAVLNNGTGSSTLWSNKTGAQIVDDIALRLAAIAQTTKGVHKPNTLAVTPVALTQMRNRKLEVGERTTAYEQFRLNHPEINIIEVPELALAFSGADGFLVGEVKPENAFFIPIGPIDFREPVYGGGGWVIETFSHFVAGGIVPYPKAFAIGTGV